MCEEHDEALVERITLALLEANRGSSFNVSAQSGDYYRQKARAIVYPPKTRLQVARELLAKADTERGCPLLAEYRLRGNYDGGAAIAAVIAALALPAMED